MLVRYRLSSVPTIEQFKADIDGIIQGTITNTSQLSTPAQTYSTIVGTYPTGIYSRVNGTTYTYSKAHNDVDTGKTHYFRLSFSSTKLDTITLARSYTSGTDTLIDSTVQDMLIYPKQYEALYATGMDIIISDKALFIQAAQMNTSGGISNYSGIFDLGHNGIARRYTNSMLMAHVTLNNQIRNNTANSTLAPLFQTTSGVTIPYSWNGDTFTYGTLTGGLAAALPLRRNQTNNQVLVIETPVTTSVAATGYVPQTVYGLYKISQSSFGGAAIYQDGDGLYRLTTQDFSIHVD